MSAIRLALLGLVLLAAPGCDERDDLDGSRKPIPGVRDAGAAFELPGGDLEAVYDLYDNRASAQVHLRGSLLIDLGTADAAKYTLGGYASGWRDGEGEPSAGIVDGRVCELRVPLDGDPGGVERDKDGALEVRLYARPAAESQLASVFVGETRIGDLALPGTGWREYEALIPEEELAAGWNELRFYFRHVAEIGGVESGATVAGVAVGGSAQAAEAPLAAETVTREGERLAALRVPASSRLSFSLAVPRRDPELVLAVAGEGAEASIRAAVDGEPSRELWSGSAGAGWEPVRVDLSDLAGEVVRLDFLAEGGAVDWGRPQLKAPAAEPEKEKEREPAEHVIVWVVSSLRDDRIGEDTPAFSRFAGAGVRFTRAVAAAPEPGLSHAAMMTGRLQEEGTIPDGAVTLAERFRRAGYVTALLSGNGFVHDENGFARGFDLYDNPMRRRHPHGAGVLWQRAKKFLKKHRDDRVFLYLATVEPHLPYQPSEGALKATWEGEKPPIQPAKTPAISEAVRAGRRHLGQTERRFVRALYDASVRDADAAFGEMLADLEKLGVAEKTAVVLVGDHGEELWERGGFGHGRTLYREVLSVPLVLRAPGLEPRRVDDIAVEGVDVYPTVLDLAGIAPNPGIMGQSALALSRRRPAIPRPVRSRAPDVGRALAIGRYQLIVPIRGEVELYDLESDPAQEENLAAERPVALGYLATVFGLGAAYEDAWSLRRWGAINNVTPAFAADNGY